MLTRRRDAVRVTHVPTGLSATAYRDRVCRRGDKAWVKTCEAEARRLLASMLARPMEAPRPVRKYDLHLPWGMEPYVREGDRVIAQGSDAVAGLWSGRIPWIPDTYPPRTA